MRRAALLLLLPLCASCLLGPNQGQELCGANAAVRFHGYAHGPSKTVYLQAAPARSGPFTTIGTVVTSATPVTYAGTQLYSFSKSVQISQWASTDATLRTYVRAVIYPTGSFLSPSYLTTYDVVSPLGGAPSLCINTRVNGGDTLSEAIAFCDSDDSPVAELTAPALSTCPCTNTTFTGDLLIDDAVDAASYVCLQTVSGSLTIADSAPENVPLPSLATVSGDLTLHYERPGTMGGGTYYYTRAIGLGALSSVGGDLLAIARSNESATSLNGLHAVTSVGGDITLQLYQTNPDVLSGLTHLPGSLTIESWPGNALDLGASATLANLQSVGGDVTVRNFYNTNNVLGQVMTIGGDLTIENVRLQGGFFPELVSVGGDLRFVSVSPYNGSIPLGPDWPALATIGGELGVLSHGSLQSLGALPMAGVLAGGLRVEGNALLHDLGGGEVQVQGAGAVNIHGNVALTQCAVTSFLAAQIAGGWTGAASVSDTLPCP